MKKLLSNRYVKLFVRDVIEAAIVAAPTAFTLVKGPWDVKALTTVLLSFGTAFVAIIRRQLGSQNANPTQ
jgi:hypothetical protein